MNPWKTEVMMAADWWTSMLIQAILVAFPERVPVKGRGKKGPVEQGNLFGSFREKLSTPEHIASFRVALVGAIDRHFEYRKVAWNPSVPLEGEADRIIRIEGHFVAAPILEAANVSDFSDMVRHFSDGCQSIINPGRVTATQSRKHKPHTMFTSDPGGSNG